MTPDCLTDKFDDVAIMNIAEKSERASQNSASTNAFLKRPTEEYWNCCLFYVNKFVNWLGKINYWNKTVSLEKSLNNRAIHAQEFYASFTANIHQEPTGAGATNQPLAISRIKGMTIRWIEMYYYYQRTRNAKCSMDISTALHIHRYAWGQLTFNCCRRVHFGSGTVGEM